MQQINFRFDIKQVRQASMSLFRPVLQRRNSFLTDDARAKFQIFSSPRPALSLYSADRLILRQPRLALRETTKPPVIGATRNLGKGQIDAFTSIKNNKETTCEVRCSRR
jgi:hypothetical protein